MRPFLGSLGRAPASFTLARDERNHRIAEIGPLINVPLCILAIAAFERAGGASYRGARVSVENDTARYPVVEDSHWREAVLATS